MSSLTSRVVVRSGRLGVCPCLRALHRPAHGSLTRRSFATRATPDEDTKTPPVASSSEKDAAAGPGRQEQGENFVAKLFADAAVNPLTYIGGIALAVKIVSVVGDTDLVIGLLAALPVVGLTALSKSPVGKRVMANLEAQLPELEERAEEVQASWVEARANNYWFGASRPQVPPALGGGAPYLTGDLAGDYGFDPLGFAAQPDDRTHHVEAELLHARWAMLATTGALIPEALSMNGLDLGEPVWWKIGAAKLNSDITLNYAGIEGFRIAGKQGIWLIVLCQLALMGGPEYARYVGIKSLQPVGVFLPGQQSYPGGAPFDPLKISESGDQFLDQQVKEIKNGRLAMIAFLGYAVQAAVTQKGPLQNLVDFVHDPAHNNITAYLPK